MRTQLVQPLDESTCALAPSGDGPSAVHPGRPAVRERHRLRPAARRGPRRRLRAGDQLPPERELAVSFAVNRHAVREAVKRLQEAGFVQVVHGGGTRVLDVRRTAGLDLLGHLARSGDEGLERLVRDGLEMRRCIGVDAARRAAERADAGTRRAIVLAATRYADPTDATADRDFWALVVDASDNLAFRLALNSLVESIDAQPDLMDCLAGRRPRRRPAARRAGRGHRRRRRRRAPPPAPTRVLSQALTIHAGHPAGAGEPPAPSSGKERLMFDIIAMAIPFFVLFIVIELRVAVVRAGRRRDRLRGPGHRHQPVHGDRQRGRRHRLQDRGAASSTPASTS